VGLSFQRKKIKAGKFAGCKSYKAPKGRVRAPFYFLLAAYLSGYLRGGRAI